MIGIDTNVLVRLLVRDEPGQFERARRLIKGEADAGERVMISQAVLLEAEWVLRSRYHLTKIETIRAFSALLGTAELVFEDEPSVEQALYTWKNSNSEFADCLIVSRHRRPGCRATATFDSRVLKRAGFISA